MNIMFVYYYKDDEKDAILGEKKDIKEKKDGGKIS